MSKVAYPGIFPQVFLFRQNPIRSDQVKSQMICFTEEQLMNYYWMPQKVLLSSSIDFSPSVSGDSIPSKDSLSLSFSQSAVVDAINGITSANQLVCNPFPWHGAIYNGKNVGNTAAGIPTWPNLNHIFYDSGSNLYYWSPNINISLAGKDISTSNGSGNVTGEVYTQDSAFQANLPNTVSNSGTAAGNEKCTDGFSISVNGWSVRCSVFSQLSIQWNHYGDTSDFTLKSINCNASLRVSVNSYWN